MKTLVISIALVAAMGRAPALADALCSPAKLVHITWRDVTPDVQSGTFAAAPRNLYRIGSGKLRVEEALDAENHLKELIIIAEPDSWLINLYDGTGKHDVDPGPTFLAKAPVIGLEGEPEKLMQFEFGCEAEFLAANAPKPDRTEDVDGEAFDVYRVTDGVDAVEVLERPGTGIPAYVRYYEKGKLTMAIRYDKYESGLADDPKLFMPPPGIRIDEAGK